MMGKGGINNPIIQRSNIWESSTREEFQASLPVRHVVALHNKYFVMPPHLSSYPL